MRIVGVITDITRLQNSASGNPRLKITISGDLQQTRTLKTAKDSQVAHQLLGIEILHLPRYVFTLDDDGEIIAAHGLGAVV